MRDSDGKVNLCTISSLATIFLLLLSVIPELAFAQMPGRRGQFMERAGVSETVRPELPQGWIDTHIHLRAGGGNYAAALQSALNQMDMAGIALSIVMPQPFPFGANNPNIHEYEKFIDTVKQNRGRLAFLGGGGTLNGLIEQAHADNRIDERVKQAFIEQAERIAQDGAAGFGEFAVEHLSHFPGHPYESVPADHPLYRQLSDIAARHGMPIDIHMDLIAEETSLPNRFASPPNPSVLKPNIAALERLLAHNRKTKIVLAHCGWDVTGQWTANRTRRLLDENPNLYMSIKIAPQGSEVNSSPLDNSGIKPEWLSVFSDYADRFVIGSDSFYAPPNAPGRGAAIFHGGVSTLLARLPKEIAVKIAYENARRIYRFQ